MTFQSSDPCLMVGPTILPNASPQEKDLTSDISTEGVARRGSLGGGRLREHCLREGSLRGRVSATGLGCLSGQGWAAQVENRVSSERRGRGKKAGDSVDATQKQEPKREPGLLLMSSSPKVTYKPF